MTQRRPLFLRNLPRISVGDPPAPMVAAVDAVERRISFGISLWLMPVRTMSESALGDAVRIHRPAMVSDGLMTLVLFFNNTPEVRR